MYADDLIGLLLSPSVTLLQKIFQVVEDELNAVEMSINPPKSSCIRFGLRYEAVCTEITTQDGSKIPLGKKF